MFSKHDYPILGERLYATLAHPQTPKVIAAFVVAALGAGLVAGWPDPSSSQTDNEKQAAASDSACEKQAWPYVDRRCADTPAYERGTRQVRVVNARGEMVTMTTPLPIIEPRRPARSQTVAKADTPIGPEAAPAAPAPAAAEIAANKTTDKAAAKQSKTPDATDKAVPGDVIAAVEKTARRRGTQKVSPDVIAAVESATSGGQVYDSGAVQRVYIVAP